MKSLHVSVPDQELRLYEGQELLRTLSVSTSKFGLGSEEGSNCTPLGDFRVNEKYGGKAPGGTIFKGRRATGLWLPGQETSEDLVLTRILRLESTQAGIENTYQRYIYLHGTNQEELIGSPASHGCIRLKNSDIVSLFEQVPVGTPVHIQNHPFS